MSALVLTKAQRLQLLTLNRAAARGRDCGVDVYREPRLNPVVIGKLRDMGLADSRVIRPAGGSQRTAYWLTPDGLEAAERLGEAQHG